MAVGSSTTWICLSLVLSLFCTNFLFVSFLVVLKFPLGLRKGLGAWVWCRLSCERVPTMLTNAELQNAPRPQAVVPTTPHRDHRQVLWPCYSWPGYGLFLLFAAFSLCLGSVTAWNRLGLWLVVTFVTFISCCVLRV